MWTFVASTLFLSCGGRSNLTWDEFRDERSLGTGGETGPSGGGSWGAGGHWTLGAGGHPVSGAGGSLSSAGGAGNSGTGGAGALLERIFVDCSATEDGDGASWNSPRRHPQLALSALAPEGLVLIKEGPCFPLVQGSPVLVVPDGLLLSLGGGYVGNPDDPYARGESHTLFSGDFGRNDTGLPFGGQSESYLQSHADNSTQILGLGDASEVWMDRIDLAGAHEDQVDIPGHSCLALGENSFGYVRDSNISDCVSVRGAAVYVADNASLFMDNVSVRETVSLGWTGAVTAVNAEIVLERGRFERNEAPFGGAIGAVSSELSLFDAVFENNNAYSEGGAISLTDGASTLHVEQCTFTENRAALGGAIHSSGGQVNATSVSFRKNQVYGLGGSLSGENGAQFLLQQSWFYGATASAGGHVHLSDSYLFSNQCHFFGGTALAGGAIFAVGNDAALPVEIVGSSFGGNDATAEAAVIRAERVHVHVENSTFTDNGNANVSLLTLSGANSTFRGVELQHNRGDGILRLTDGRVRLINSFVGRNDAGSLGLVVLREDAILHSVGTSFAENVSAGVSTPLAALSTNARLDFDNSVLWASSPSPGAWLNVSAGGTATTTGSCGPAALSAYGTLTALTESPFEDRGEHFPLLFRAESPCMDQGDNDLAQTWFPEFESHFAEWPLVTDTAPVDPGFHFSPAVPRTRDLNATTSELSWNINDPAWPCRIVALAHDFVALEGGADNSLSVSHPPGTKYLIACFNSTSATPVLLSITN